jgi:hypothetical protein
MSIRLSNTPSLKRIQEELGVTKAQAEWIKYNIMPSGRFSERHIAESLRDVGRAMGAVGTAAIYDGGHDNMLAMLVDVHDQYTPTLVYRWDLEKFQIMDMEALFGVLERKGFDPRF